MLFWLKQKKNQYILQVIDKDWNYIAKLEKAISQKYGKLATRNPKSDWDENKEKQYLEQLKELAEKERKIEEFP